MELAEEYDCSVDEMKQQLDFLNNEVKNGLIVLLSMIILKLLKKYQLCSIGRYF